ncbi:uncharacterized protein LOC105690826 isoform X2 [Athalia rosae]|uniref:uncharacterized protein LOC105690826 isoform X2 n=1 Tax=Athalia rosae TaxID=37344 RepID=UPI00203451C2|nr:uncharacterized protein LOC105690826 isoform X2 [Athalia rosae]
MDDNTVTEQKDSLSTSNLRVDVVSKNLKRRKRSALMNNRRKRKPKKDDKLEPVIAKDDTGSSISGVLSKTDIHNKSMPEMKHSEKVISFKRRESRPIESKKLVKIEATDTDKSEFETKAIISGLETKKKSLSETPVNHIYELRSSTSKELQPSKAINTNYDSESKDFDIHSASSAKFDPVPAITEANAESEWDIENKRMQGHSESKTAALNSCPSLVIRILNTVIDMKNHSRQKSTEPIGKCTSSSKRNPQRRHSESESKSSLSTKTPTGPIEKTKKLKDQHAFKLTTGRPKTLARTRSIKETSNPLNKISLDLLKESWMRTIDAVASGIIEPSTKRSSETKTANNLEIPETTEINNNLSDNADNLPSTIESKIDSLSKTTNQKHKKKRCGKPKDQIENSAILETNCKPTGRKSSKYPTISNSKVKDRTSDNKTSQNSIFSSAGSRHLLLDKSYQPKVLLPNIAYTNILSPKHRKILFHKKKSLTNASLETRSYLSFDSDTEQTTFNLTTSSEHQNLHRTPEIISTPKLEKHKYPTFKTELLYKKTDAGGLTESNVSCSETKPKKQSLTKIGLLKHTELLCGSKTNSSMSETDGISSMNKEAVGNKLVAGPLITELSLEKSRLTENSNVSLKSVHPVLLRPQPSSIKPEFERVKPKSPPHAILHIRQRLQKLKCESENETPRSTKYGDVSIAEPVSATNRHTIRRDTSSSNVTDLSTSLMASDCHISFEQSQNIGDFGSTNSVHKIRVLRKTASKSENSASCSSAKFGKLWQTARAPSTWARKKNTAKSEKPSVPVSISVDNCGNSLSTIYRELDEFIHIKKKDPKNSETESQTKSNLGKYQAPLHLENSSCSLGLRTTHLKHEPLIAHRVTSNQMNLNNPDLPLSATTLEHNNNAPTTQTSSQCKIQQSLDRGRNLPKIISIDVFPKGTIPLSIKGCTASKPFIDATDTEKKIHCLENVSKISRYENITLETNQSQSTNELLHDIDDSNEISTHASDVEIIDDWHSIGNSAMDGFTKQDTQISPFTHENEQSAKVTQAEATHQNPTVSPHQFDSKNFWKICPELVTFYNNDVINNNDEGRSPNSDAFEVSGDNNYASMGYTARENKLNFQDEDLQSNVDTHSKEYEKQPTRFNDMVFVNDDHHEIDQQISEHTFTKPITSKTSVKSDLTIANVKKFTDSMTDNDKPNLNWFVETHQYISSPSTSKKHIKPVETIPSSASQLVESTTDHQMENLQNQYKQRKRKWLSDDGRNKNSDRSKQTRLILNRNSWNINQEDSENVSKSQKPISVDCVARNNLENVTVATTKLSDECNVIKSQSNQTQCEYQSLYESDQKSSCYNKTNKKARIDISTRTSADLIVNVESSYSKEDLGNNNVVQVEPSIKSSPIKTRQSGCNTRIDKNGNSTSSSSLQSSSSSKTTSTNISPTGSTKSSKSETKTSNVEKMMIDGTEPKNADKQEDEELNYEYSDDDYISIFADSILTGLDQSPTYTDDVAMSPCVPNSESNSKFREMTDFGAYVQKNVEECNEAYKFYTQKSANVNNQKNADNFPWHGTSIPEANIVPLPMNPLGQNCPKLERINLKTRLGLSQGAPGAFSKRAMNVLSGQCFARLKRGSCTRKNCHWNHSLNRELQNLEYESPEMIHEVIKLAIVKGLNFFVQCAYARLTVKMNYDNVIRLFSSVYKAGMLNTEMMKSTLLTLTTIDIPLPAIVSALANLLSENDSHSAESILIFVGERISSGVYWNTVRDLLIKIKPPDMSIDIVISECVSLHENKAHMRDVHDNFYKRLTMEQLTSMNVNLRKRFNYLLLDNDLIYPRVSSGRLLKSPALDNTESKYVTVNTNIKKTEIPTISSPDATQYFDDMLPIPYHDLQLSQTCQKTSLQKQLMKQPMMINQGSSRSGRDSYTSSVHHGGATNSQYNPMNNQKSSNLNVQSDTTEVPITSWKLHEIEGLCAPHSSHSRERHWKFYLDMKILTEALKREEYEHVLKTLNEYSDTERSLFTTSCFKMLHQTVLASARHVRNMIKLSVRMGVQISLSETLISLGLYTMIELCDANAWILAYSLLKSMQCIGFQENTATIVLLLAEIYIANRRPLKAFDILKQNNMFYTKPDKWRVSSNPNDDLHRTVIIELLLDLLCQEFIEWAFYLFTYLLREQTHIYHPIDLTARIDKLVLGILRTQPDDVVIEVGRLILDNMFTLKSSVFRSLVINICRKDERLSRQLYYYSSWLGVYPILQLEMPLHILIKTHWTKEEMYLVMTDFLEKLSMNIGPTVQRLCSNHFSIYLVFEVS